MNSDKNTPVTVPLGWSDLHFHRYGLTDEAFCAFLERAKQAGVGRLICSAAALFGPDAIFSWKNGGILEPSGFEEVRRGARLARKIFGEPRLTTTFGIHPWQVEKTEALVAQNALPSGGWEAILHHYLTAPEEPAPDENAPKKTAPFALTPSGIGEIGLDFALRGLNAERKNRQWKYFRRQLQIAQELHRPVILHSVRAGEETLETLALFDNIPLVLMHGFADRPEFALRGAEKGYYFSFSERDISDKNLKARAVIAALPEDRILLESDYADSASEGESASIPKTAARIAAFRGIAPEAFAERIHRNEEDFFAQWRNTGE